MGHQLKKSKTISFKKPKKLNLVFMEDNCKGNQSLIGHATITCDNVKLKDGEKWEKFVIICDLDDFGLLDLRAEVTKAYYETVDVIKTEEVPLSEEEYNKAVEEAKAASEVKSAELTKARDEKLKKE